MYLALAARRPVEQALRAGKSTVLLCTDVAARGLDVKGLSAVVNYDLPRATADDAGRERFHWHRPAVEAAATGRLYVHLSDSARPGRACCSNESVSYHYVDSPQLMRCMHKLLS